MKKFIIMSLIILCLPVVASAQPKTITMHRIDDSGIYWVPDDVKIKAVTLDGNFTSDYAITGNGNLDVFSAKLGSVVEVTAN